MTYSNGCAIIFLAKALRDTISVAVASSHSEGVIFFAFLRTEGGGIMGEYITWDDLIKIAMLVIAIIACFRNKKKITALTSNLRRLSINIT